VQPLLKLKKGGIFVKKRVQSLLFFLITLAIVTYPFSLVQSDNLNNFSNNKQKTVSYHKTIFTDKISSPKALHHTLETLENMPANPNITSSPNALHITAIGDSLTKGIGDEPSNDGFIQIIEDYLSSFSKGKYTIEKFGKRGNRTDQLIKRLDEDEMINSLRKADIVLITIGANDIMKIAKKNFLSLSYDDFAAEQKNYQHRLRQIFSKIRKINSTAHIYLIGLYNPFEEYFGDIPELEKIIDDWNWIGQMVVKSQPKATFIPIKNIFKNTNEGLLYEDNFHPNERGYQLIGKQVLQYILKTYGKY
jgi:lysophospholipase L1-like esterase